MEQVRSFKLREQPGPVTFDGICLHGGNPRSPASGGSWSLCGLMDHGSPRKRKVAGLVVIGQVLLRGHLRSVRALEFEKAAALRDEIVRLRHQLAQET
jgi:hypothetical protein